MVMRSPQRLGTDAVKGDGTPFAPEDQPDALALRTGLPSPSMIMGISRDGASAPGSRCVLIR